MSRKPTWLSAFVCFAAVLPRDGRRTRRDGRRYGGKALRDDSHGLTGLRPTRASSFNYLEAARCVALDATFGGTEFDTLFVTCGDKVYQRKIRVTDAKTTEPTKPSKARL